MKELGNRSNNHPVYTKKLQTNHRTYYFDVRKTRNGQKYVTITEVRKKFNNRDGRTYIDKSKIFLYGENFEDFSSSLSEVLNHAAEGEINYNIDNRFASREDNLEEKANNDMVNVSFEDLKEDSSII